MHPFSTVAITMTTCLQGKFSTDIYTPVCIYELKLFETPYALQYLNHFDGFHDVRSGNPECRLLLVLIMKSESSL
jgi:hypothetical protein